jgi:antitoxin (DNA-binding transcriptional repressor) of toxin-antitoxin stability system
MTTKTVDISAGQTSIAELLSSLTAGSEIVLTQGNTAVAFLAPLGMESLQVSRFENAGIVYRLKRPLFIEVQYQDALWSYRCEEINLWGSGESREDALHDLHENFAYLWREFAEEEDSRLDGKSLQIKRKLLDLTERQTAGV